MRTNNAALCRGQVYEDANRDVTGWTGTDCSMPMCAQGFFDPFCTDLPQAPGGEVGRNLRDMSTPTYETLSVVALSRQK